MRIAFEATEFGAQDDGFTLVCGASNATADDEADYHYIMLQRSSGPNDNDDDGIYFVIDDQVNGSYDALKSCDYSASKLVIELHRGTSWYPDVQIIEISLPDSPNDLSSLAVALKRIFHDRPGDLNIRA